MNMRVDNGDPQRVFGEMVSGNYFEALGVHPSLGRAFRAEEGSVPGRHAVAVISHKFWLRRFDGDPSIVGRTISLNSIAFTVIGVAPDGFHGTQPYLNLDLWVPLMMQPALGADRLHLRSNRWLQVHRSHEAGRRHRAGGGRPGIGRTGPGSHVRRGRRQRDQAVRTVAGAKHGRHRGHRRHGRAAGRGRRRAADRVRQRREPPAGKRGHAPARNGGPADARRQPQPSRAADAHREQSPRHRRRPRRAAVRVLDQRPRAFVHPAGAAADRHQPATERRGHVVRGRRHPVHRGAVRAGPGAAGRDRVADDRVERVGDRGHRNTEARACAQGAGGGSGRAVAGAARVGGPVRSHADERAVGGSRVFDTKRPGRRRRSAAGRLRCAARPIVLSGRACARPRDPGHRGGLPGRAHVARIQRKQRHRRDDRRLHACSQRGDLALLQPRELRLPEDTGHHARRRTGVHRSRHARAPGRHDCERDARATVLRRTQSRGRPHPRRQARTAGRGRRTRRQVQQHHGASAAVHVSADAAVVSRRRGLDRQDRRRSSVDRPTPSRDASSDSTPTSRSSTSGRSRSTWKRRSSSNAWSPAC